MDTHAQDLTALESCLRALERLVIDMKRLKFEEEYEEKRGGYSDVRVATLDSESLAPKLVVAKTIRLKALHKEPHRLAFRLARELKVWAGLKHPHVLPLLGYYLEKDYKLAVLISDYMVYGDLTEYIEQEKPSWDSLLRIVRDSTDGLAYLHRQKPAILHGDIKKGNVLINAERRALLADFGLSKALEEAPSGLTTSKGLKGTLRYFSPELIKEMDTPHPLASDIWAWACLVLEVLTNTIPYANKKAEHLVMLALVNDELPADIESLPIQIPDLKFLLAKCWAIQPNERPSASFCLRILNSVVSTSSTPDHVEDVAVDPPPALRPPTPETSKDMIHIFPPTVPTHPNHDVVPGTSGSSGRHVLKELDKLARLPPEDGRAEMPIPLALASPALWTSPNPSQPQAELSRRPQAFHYFYISNSKASTPQTLEPSKRAALQLKPPPAPVPSAPTTSNDPTPIPSSGEKPQPDRKITPSTSSSDRSQIGRQPIMLERSPPAEGRTQKPRLSVSDFFSLRTWFNLLQSPRQSSSGPPTPDCLNTPNSEVDTPPDPNHVRSIVAQPPPIPMPPGPETSTDLIPIPPPTVPINPNQKIAPATSGSSRSHTQKEPDKPAGSLAQMFTTPTTPKGPSITGDSHTHLLWTSANPLQSQLFTTLGTLYRFDTVTTGSKTITTLYRSVKNGKEDCVARLEWGYNYSLGRAIIGRTVVAMADLVLTGDEPSHRCFFGPDGYQYAWCPYPSMDDFVLQDFDGNIIAMFRPIFPVQKYYIGEVHGEIFLLNNAGRGMVLFPPLTDMICLTAMLNRVLNEREAGQ